LLVVPLRAEEAGLLTLAEYDRLLARDVVVFEDGSHPLLERLRSGGAEVATVDGSGAMTAARDSWAFVAEPASPAIVELAKQGAEVSAGPAAAPDALTAAHGAPVVRRAGAAASELAAVMARLRSDDGCPWDREQTHESLKVHLLEEAYEVIDAIDADATGAELEEELGDLLLQVAFHARLGELEGRFDLASVARTIVAKLVHRHPHVFGDASVDSANEVVSRWEAIKKEEKRRLDPFEGIPDALPALLTASKVQKRAASLGISPDKGRARAALEESLARPATTDSIGDALFWLVAVARAAGIDPEGALRQATRRFRDSAGTA
jgi:MazG family protein